MYKKHDYAKAIQLLTSTIGCDEEKLINFLTSLDVVLGTKGFNNIRETLKNIYNNISNTDIRDNKQINERIPKEDTIYWFIKHWIPNNGFKILERRGRQFKISNQSQTITTFIKVHTANKEKNNGRKVGFSVSGLNNKEQWYLFIIPSWDAIYLKNAKDITPNINNSNTGCVSISKGIPNDLFEFRIKDIFPTK